MNPYKIDLLKELATHNRRFAMDLRDYTQRTHKSTKTLLTLIYLSLVVVLTSIGFDVYFQDYSYAVIQTFAGAMVVWSMTKIREIYRYERETLDILDDFLEDRHD